MTNAIPASRPTGFRRLTPTMLAARDRADKYTGAPKGAASMFRYLDAFKQAEPYLGLPPHAYKLIDWLVKTTMPHDWEEGARPISWPSAALQERFLGLSEARVKNLNRTLFEAGIFILRDSPTGKRFGRRGADKRIIEAYGFDLSPLAYRYEEFVCIAEDARALNGRLKTLRTRATCARKAIAQAADALTVAGLIPDHWPSIAAQIAELTASIKRAKNEIDLTSIAERLEAHKHHVESWLQKTVKPIELAPKGLVNDPLNRTTNQSFSNPKDTVIEIEEGRGVGAPFTPISTQIPKKTRAGGPGSGFPTTAAEKPVAKPPCGPPPKITPAELVKLAPRLASYIHQSSPAWPDVVNAAGLLHRELGISQKSWGDACHIMGRQIAAITVAVVSTKPHNYFIRSAAGYFSAMVKKAQTNELHLDRTVWKLRQNAFQIIPPLPEKIPALKLPISSQIWQSKQHDSHFR